MKRTTLLFVVAIGGILAALLLPRLRQQTQVQPPQLVVTPTPTPPPALPNGSLTIRGRPARHAILASGDNLDVVYEISAATAPNEQRLPVDFALVFDRSGSMSGEPLQKARAAAISLIDRLSERDRLAIVHFGSEARLGLNATAMDEEGKAIARRVISDIQADGSTNMSAALTEAEQALLRAGAREGAVRRLVLLSDGEANEGILGQGLVDLVRHLNGEKMRVSALGLGLEFDEDTMLALADAGGGQYRYLRNADEVASALTQELSQAASTAASALSLQLFPGDGVTIRDVFGYDVVRDGNAIRLGLSDLAGGETRRVVIRVHSGNGSTGARTLVDARLSYDDVRANHQARGAQVLAEVEATGDSTKVALSYDKDAASTSLRARWGGSLIHAMHDYEKNDSAKATQDLDNGLMELQKEAAAAGDAKLAEELSKRKDEAVQLMAAPAAAPAGSMARKQLKSYALETSR